MKICLICNQLKSLTDFHQHKTAKDKLKSSCKICSNIASKEYRLKNKHRLDNPDCKVMIAARGLRYRENNKDKVKARKAAYRNNNKELIKIKDAIYGAKYHKSHPWAVRIRVNRRRVLKDINGGILSKNIIPKLFKLQKGLCPCCKESLSNAYHLDHIIPLYLGGTNSDDNVQLLRATCNLQKGIKHPIDFMQGRGFLL
jgi:5-methylcytosine-specific restriction endonuclease McrA